MKTIPNKKFTISLGDQSQELSYVELCKTAISSTPRDGFGLQDYSQRIKILDVLDNSKDIIELEDADHALLVSSLDNFKPAILDKNIGEWIEAVKGA